jgi:carbonic anhydrase
MKPVSCFDGRANPSDFLEIEYRDCFVLRNAGGRFATAAEQIAALDTLFTVEQIILVHHSNCGTSHVTKQQTVDRVKEQRPEFTAFEALKARLPMKEDNHLSLLEDFEQVKNCGFLRKDLIESVVGFWYDVETGLVTKVEQGQTQL